MLVRPSVSGDLRECKREGGGERIQSAARERGTNRRRRIEQTRWKRSIIMQAANSGDGHVDQVSSQTPPCRSEKKGYVTQGNSMKLAGEVRRRSRGWRVLSKIG